MAMKGSQLAATVAPEVGVDERDLVITRYHGLSPMGNHKSGLLWLAQTASSRQSVGRRVAGTDPV